MKLNYRDKIVLTIAIVALVWIAGIMFFIKPGIEDYKTAQATLDDAKAQLATLQQRIEEDKDIDDRIVKAYNEANDLTSTFYEYQQAQEATQKVDDLLKEENIVNLDMSITEYQSYPLSKYVYFDNTVVTELDATVNDYENTKEGMYIPDELASDDGTEPQTVITKNDTKNVNLTNIGRYSMTFTYKGKLGDLKEFCRKLQEVNKEKTIIIQSLSFNYPEEKKEEEEEEEEEVVETEEGEDGEEKPKPTTTKKEKKEEEEEEIDPNEKVVTGEITVNMIVVRKLPDPKNF